MPWLRAANRVRADALSWLSARRRSWADWRRNTLGESLRSSATPYGFSLVTRDDPVSGAMLDGTFEPDEVRIVEEGLAGADVFVDVGANVGFFSCIALKRGKHVIAVEPQPRNLRCFYANLVANGWQDAAEVFPLGLAERPGVRVLYGASGLSASLIPGWASLGRRFRQTIPVTTLDILLGDRFAGQRLVVKVDVEGCECQVLRGGLATLARRPRPLWLVEIFLAENHPAGANPDFRATFELFWRHGYEARTADRRDILIRPEDVDAWRSSGRSGSGTFNYVFRAAGRDA